MKKLFNVLSLVLMLSMLLTTSVIADTLVTDTVLAAGYVDFGEVCKTATVSRDIPFKLSRQGQPFVDYGTLTLHGDAPANGFSRVLGIDVTIDLPYGWATASNNSLTTDTATGVVGFTAGETLGVFTSTATYRAVDTTTRNATHGVSLKATVVDCGGPELITPTLVITNSPVTYDGSPQAATVVAKDDETDVLGSVSNVKYDGSLTAPTDAGTYAVTADFTPTDATTYESLTGASAGNFVIDKADPVCTITGWSGTYDGQPHGATGSCLGVDDEELEGLVIAATTYTNVPGGLVAWTFIDVTGNYNDDSGSAQVTIDKADPVCTIVGWTGYYDGFPHGASGTCLGVLDEELAGLDLGSTFTAVNEPNGQLAYWTFTDVTGNYNDDSGSVTILIKAWTLYGFYRPVDMDGVWNTIKGGQTVPLKFNIWAGTTELKETSYIASFKTQKVSCPNEAEVTTDAIEITSTGGTSLRYDLTEGQFIQNWKTPREKNVCYAVTMTTQDGSFLKALFMLK